MTTSNEQKLAVKFKLSAADVTKLLAAGFNTPAKIRSATNGSKLPVTLSAGAKSYLDGRFKK